MLLVFVNTYTKDANNNVGMSEVLVLYGAIHGRLRVFLRPGTMGGVGVSNGTVPRRIIHSAGVFFVMCVLVFTSSVFLVTFSSFGLVAGFATITTAFGGVKPNLRLMKPAKGFNVFS